MKHLLAAGLAVALCAAVAAQQEPTFRTGVDLIAVDVAVVDARGRPVEDLRAPDFAVKIDGEARRVVSAELVKVDVEAARKTAQDRTETFYTSNLTPPDARLIVIAIDQSNIHPAAIKPILGAASRFLDRLSPLDQVAFVTYPELGPRVNFTTDRLRIRLAMERLIGQAPPIAYSQITMGVSEALAIEVKRDQIVMAEVVGRECGRFDAQMRAQCERDVVNEASQIVRRTREGAEASLNGLRELLLQLSFVDGSKSLILVSEGLAVDGANELAPLVALAGQARTSINVMAVDLGSNDVTITERPPTLAQDRRLQMSGLEGLAAMSRGSLFHIVGTGEPIFERLASEISAYYLLGVEQRPGDERADRRRIDIEVRRRDVTIRSRQAFVLSAASGARRRSVEESLTDALTSPFAVSGVPVRVTTFAQQDAAPGKVQVMIAAQVGAPGAVAAEYHVGFLLVDDQNRVAASFNGKRMLSPLAGSPTEPLSFLGSAAVDPGVYSLRLAVVDPEGRRGSVIRDVNAWKLAGEAFASGDLIVGNVPPAGDGVRPSVEPHITTDAVAMIVELYSTTDATWNGIDVTFEIADDEHSTALVSWAPRLAAGRQPISRTAAGVLAAAALPPGPYVARAQVRRDGKLVGALARPFVLERAAGTRAVAPAAAAAAAVSFAETLPRFDRAAVLSSEMITSMLDLVETRAPGLKAVLAQARAGRYGSAAVEALAEGDQTVAAFLRGLDLFSRGQLDQAATQLDIASGSRREFFPAAFYLGAAFAAVGRDREAAGIWQLALGSEPRPAVFYLMVADARLRDGQAQSAIDILKPAYERDGGNDEIGRRLGIAYVLTGQYADAVPVIDGYLTRHAADQDMLLAAVVAQYEVARAGGALSNIDRARLRRYATAYRGPHQALVEKYLDTMQVR